MNTIFNQVTSFLLVPFFIASCTQPSDKPAEDAQQAAPDTVVQQASKPVIRTNEVTLKGMLIDEQTMVLDNALTKNKELTTAEKKALSIPVLDSTASPGNGFTYHLIDTLFVGAQFQVLLIGRAYTEENTAWIATYGANNSLIDHRLAYYDNSEGFLSITSEVTKEAITTKTLNEYAEVEAEKQQTEVYKINTQGKFIKEK